MNTFKPCFHFLIKAAVALAVGAAIALLSNTASVAGDIKLNELKTRTDTYKNVTVTGKNRTDIFIVHSGGMANVKIKDLDAETLWQIGMGPEPPRPAALAPTATSTAAAPAVAAATVPAPSTEMAGLTPEELKQKMLASFVNPEQIPQIQLDPVVIAIGTAIFLLFYLFYCYCLKLIVAKTGNEPGIMVWLPFFQVFPMLRAAGMSGWWVLALLVPAVNIVVQIIWCVKIAQARGKGILVAILLILPVTNFFAFLYLAFSGAENLEDDDDQPVVIPPLLSEA